MPPTPNQVRGKCKRQAQSPPPANPPLSVRPCRRRRRPRPPPFDRRLPLEILERIFLLSENVNLPRATLLLGHRLSGHSILLDLLIAAFGPTWSAQDADVGNPVFQSSVLACSWLTADLLLDAQQLWLRYHHTASFHHTLAAIDDHPRLLTTARNRSRLAALLENHTHWGRCRGARPHDAPAAPPLPSPWPHTVHTCFAVEFGLLVQLASKPTTSATFVSLDSAPVSAATSVGRRIKRPSRTAAGSVLPRGAEAHRLVCIPERLLLAGGPYPSSMARADVHRRLANVACTLFWLAAGGARLQPATDSWEVTRLGVTNLLQIDLLDSTPDTPDGDGKGITPDALYSIDILVATIIGLFHSLGVFSQQWPTLVLDDLEEEVYIHHTRDSRFHTTRTYFSLCSILQLLSA